jgi:hypothetical protein
MKESKVERKALQDNMERLHRELLESLNSETKKNTDLIKPDQQKVAEGLICEEPDMIRVQDLQHDNSSLNETTNIDVGETGIVLNIHQDASKEDEMNTDSKDKEKPVFTNSNKIIDQNVELIKQVATEEVTERPELHSEIVYVDSVRSLDDRQLNQQIDVQRHRKFKKRTQGIGVSSEKLIAVHSRVIQRAVPAVRKGNMRKRSGSENTARRMPQSKTSQKFNMRRDNRVEKVPLPPTEGKTSDRIIRKPQQVGSSIRPYC